MGNYTPERLLDLAELVACDKDSDELDAANALRAYAATLRQQAGRVDAFAPIPEAKDAPTDELWNAYNAFNDRFCGFNTQQALRDAINTVLANRAALAQNTQGDGDAAVEYRVALWDSGRWLKIPDGLYRISYMDAGYCSITRYAERERVPELEVPDSNGSLPHERAASYAYGWNACRKAMLAAAPSQRAEVK